MLFHSHSALLGRVIGIIIVATLLHLCDVGVVADKTANERLTDLDQRLAKIEQLLEKDTNSIFETRSKNHQKVQDSDELENIIVKRQVIAEDGGPIEAPLLERIEERLGQLMERIEVLNTTVLTVERNFASLERNLLTLTQAQAITITAHLSSVITANDYNITSVLAAEIAQVRAEMLSMQGGLLSRIREFHQPPTNISGYDDCQSAWEQGVRATGVYKLSPPGFPIFHARCEFDSLHGWTVIQRRYDGSVNFYLPWESYKDGFGDPNMEHWLGNNNIYALTRRNRKLSVYLRKYTGLEGTANYSSFYINDESDNYRLTISGYSGNIGDQLSYHHGYQFSTRDADHDGMSECDCAVVHTGAWWYASGYCYSSNLNGVWRSSSTGSWPNIVWGGSWGGGYSATISRTTMRVTRD